MFSLRRPFNFLVQILGSQVAVQSGWSFGKRLDIYTFEGLWHINNKDMRLDQSTTYVSIINKKKTNDSYGFLRRFNAKWNNSCFPHVMIPLSLSHTPLLPSTLYNLDSTQYCSKFSGDLHVPRLKGNFSVPSDFTSSYLPLQSILALNPVLSYSCDTAHL